jgi:hypothetical protein
MRSSTSPPYRLHGGSDSFILQNTLTLKARVKCAKVTTPDSVCVIQPYSCEIVFCLSPLDEKYVTRHKIYHHHLRFVHSTVVFLRPKLSFAICLCL